MKCDKIVIARYTESIKWIFTNKLLDENERILIYNKGPKVSFRHKHMVVIDRPNVPNYGRESETYLSHIVSNYEKLDNYTVFIQGLICPVPLTIYLYVVSCSNPTGPLG